MLNLLKYLDARMGEPSTWAGLAAMLMAAHVNISPGLMADITTWGTIFAGVLSVVLAEIGTGKSPAVMAQDALNAFIAAVKAMPQAPAKTTVVASSTTTGPIS